MSTEDMLTSTGPEFPALSDYSLHQDTPGLLVHALSVPPLSLGLLSIPQSLLTFHLTSCSVFVHAGLTLVLFTPSTAARESFASQLCLPTALTHGRFASSLCLCLCLYQQGLAGTGQSPRRDSQALCLTSSGRVLVFLCDQLVFQQHVSHLFA